MITFSNLGKKGNLGNQMFQIASTIGMAQKYNRNFCFPNWEYSKYFEYNFSTCDLDNFELLNEEKFCFHNWKIFDKNYNLNGWLQTEKYFLESNIKNVFKFNSKFESNLVEKYNFLFSKKNVLITVRRGDFVNNPNYHQLSYKYYLTALLHHFGSLEEYNIVFTSDSMDYCKKHFSFLPNVFFLEKLSPIEQLCLGSKFDNYIISNSTFSWWLAWLGEEDETKIIRPIRVFNGEYTQKFDESDYFPERWIMHDESDFILSNSYFKLKIYGFFYELREKIIYISKKKKKLFKNIIKNFVGYK